MLQDKKTKIAEFKTDIKLITTYTRQYNTLFKDYQRSNDSTKLLEFVNSWKESKQIESVVCRWDTTHERRHMHVAYALLKGKTLKQIERKSRKELDHRLVRKYILMYTDSLELAESIEISGDSDPSLLDKVLHIFK